MERKIDELSHLMDLPPHAYGLYREQGGKLISGSIYDRSMAKVYLTKTWGYNPKLDSQTAKNPLNRLQLLGLGDFVMIQKVAASSDPVITNKKEHNQRRS